MIVFGDTIRQIRFYIPNLTINLLLAFDFRMISDDLQLLNQLIPIICQTINNIRTSFIPEHVRLKRLQHDFLHNLSLFFR